MANLRLTQNPPTTHEDFLPTRPLVDPRALVGELGAMAMLVEGAPPEATLIQHLVIAGAHLGRRVWTCVHGQRVFPNLFAITTGGSSLVAGMTLAPVLNLFSAAERCGPQIRGGFNSAFALVHSVHDKIVKPDREATPVGERAKWSETLVDPGVPDKRVVVRQWINREDLWSDRRSIELRRALITAFHGGALFCQLPMWQGGSLTVRESHIAALFGCDPGTLLHLPDEFLAMCLITVLPEPPADLTTEFTYEPEVQVTLGSDLRDMLRDRSGEVPISAQASRLLSEAFGSPVELIKLTKVCLNYSLVNCSAAVEEEHVVAAKAVLAHSAASFKWARAVWGLEEVRDRIVRALEEESPRSKTGFYRDVFGCNVPATRIEAALRSLEADRLARRLEVDGGPGRKVGRRAEYWIPVEQPAECA